MYLHTVLEEHKKQKNKGTEVPLFLYHEPALSWSMIHIFPDVTVPVA